MRVGTGYDVHRFADDRKLVLCGVPIPYEKGLLGHSDADVALHAIMDALLGAAALGDIGEHFPDQDPRYEGVSSLELLKKVRDMLLEHLFVIENIDVTIVAQEPRIRPYVERMRHMVANALRIGVDQVSVKATTEEGLGFTGAKLGIAAQAVCALSSAGEDFDRQAGPGYPEGRGCCGAACPAGKPESCPFRNNPEEKTGQEEKPVSWEDMPDCGGCGDDWGGVRDDD